MIGNAPTQAVFAAFFKSYYCCFTTVSEVQQKFAVLQNNSKPS